MFSPDSVTTAALVVTELASNAVKHAMSELTVELDIVAPSTDMTGPRELRIAVSDLDSRLPRTDPIDDGALGGRGLWLVTALSDAFGVDNSIDGKTVWAVLLEHATPQSEVAQSAPARAISAADSIPANCPEALRVDAVAPAQPAHA